jgi:predicted porin
MQRHPIYLSILAGFGSLALGMSPAQASDQDDLRAEINAQRVRLEALEKKLESAAAQTAKAASGKAGEAAPASAKGLRMPDGLSIYGIADAGVEIGNYGQGSKARVQSGLGSASRLGFKGERSFGDDLSAYFQLETGISLDNGQNTGHSSNISNPGAGTASSAAPNTTGVAVFSRNTFVGLKSEKFGDLRFGRDYVPIYSITSVSDPFSIGGATPFRLWSGAAASRFDNGVYYASPVLGGLQGKLAYSSGMDNNSQSDIGVSGGAPANSATGPQNEGKGYSASLSYRNGPLFLGTGYLSFQRAGSVSAPATSNVHRNAWNLAGTYDLGSAKVYGQYLRGKDTQSGATPETSLDRSVWWLGVSVPVASRHTVRAVYGRLDDRLKNNRDSAHIGIGYEYALDKQTDLYTYYARVSNKNGGQNSLCAGGTCQGYDKDSGLPPGFSPSSLMVGARYRF